MIKIWAKIIDNEKIVKSFELKVNNYDYHKFDQYIRKIAEKLDIPTPIVLDQHIIDFTVYHSTKFVKSDFVESIDFDKLALQSI